MGTCVLLLMEYLSHFLFTKWDKWQKMETQMLLYNDRTARKMNSWDGTLSAFEKVSLMLRFKDGFLVFFVWEFLYLDCIDILGQIVLCCGGLFSRLWDVQEHSWPLPTKCSDRPEWQLKLPVSRRFQLSLLYTETTSFRNSALYWCLRKNKLYELLLAVRANFGFNASLLL